MPDIPVGIAYSIPIRTFSKGFLNPTRIVGSFQDVAASLRGPEEHRSRHAFKHRHQKQYVALPYDWQITTPDGPKVWLPPVGPWIVMLGEGTPQEGLAGATGRIDLRLGTRVRVWTVRPSLGLLGASGEGKQEAYQENAFHAASFISRRAAFKATNRSQAESVRPLARAAFCHNAMSSDSALILIWGRVSFAMAIVYHKRKGSAMLKYARILPCLLTLKLDNR